MNQQIIAIAQQLEAEGIKWDFADYVVQTLRIRASSLHEAVDPYLLLTAAYGDIGAVIMTANDKLVYYYWEGLGGARGKDRDWLSTSAFIDEFDRFILLWHLDTPNPNPYFE
jgi:hypothetical protein